MARLGSRIKPEQKGPSLNLSLHTTPTPYRRSSKNPLQITPETNASLMLHIASLNIPKVQADSD